MDSNFLNNIFTGTNMIVFFYKAFIIVFALMYFVYAIILKKQINIMNTTLRTNAYGFISLVSSLQILISILLIILAIFAA
ncbi:MAG: hypothetical protein HYW86_01095 [Candidatus Roizmanbacteria bacterium]|nr:MAG: hypothetical protein HYW86_01095 [Candidatus Roizmanbacteria bacterium]